MTKRLNRELMRGFTLIELLVVIAIIGILSSVVLASLNTARGKGANAAVKANLAGIRAQTEIVYDNAPGTYVNVCTNPVVVSGINAAKSAAGITSATTIQGAGTNTTAVCNSIATGWAIQVPLKVGEGAGATTILWCVDGVGFSGGLTATGITAAGDVACQ
jgi:type IV pilus assembly protein PilA